MIMLYRKYKTPEEPKQRNPRELISVNGKDGKKHLLLFFCLSIYEDEKHTLESMPSRKSSITLCILLSMLNLCKGVNLNIRDLKTLAICILAYAGFPRFSEVSVPKRDHIDN